MLILTNRISNIFWKTSIGFDDRVGNLAFGLSEKAHKGNIYISIAETFGDIGHGLFTGRSSPSMI